MLTYWKHITVGWLTALCSLRSARSSNEHTPLENALLECTTRFHDSGLVLTTVYLYLRRKQCHRCMSLPHLHSINAIFRANRSRRGLDEDPRYVECTPRDHTSKCTYDNNVVHGSSPFIYGSDCNREYTLTVHATRRAHFLEGVTTYPRAVQVSVLRHEG